MLKTQILKEYLIANKYIDVERNVQKLKTNSNNVEKDDVFLAINSGNLYIDQAVENGAGLVIYDQGENFKKKCVKVENSIKFLQDFSSYYLEKIGAKVIGVTGSNGKTTIKDIIYNIISKKYKTKKTIGNFNNHIGLPLSILQLEEGDEYIVLEMGMSAPGEIENLAKIALPDYAVISNIGESHLEFLKTKENIFKAKIEILPYVKKQTFINGDDIYLKQLNLKKSGFDDGNEIKARELKIDDNGSEFVLEIEGKASKVKTNLRGKYNINNLLLGIAVSLEIGINLEEILERVEDIQISKMRFEEIESGETIYINDAYNASPSSMKASLELFSEIYNDRSKYIVLGDMLELGEKAVQLHKSLKNIIKKINYDYIYLYGEMMENLYEELKFNKNIEYFKSKEEIKEKLNEKNEKRVVFLKASRGIKLEEIIE